MKLLTINYQDTYGTEVIGKSVTMKFQPEGNGLYKLIVTEEALQDIVDMANIRGLDIKLEEKE